MRRWAGRRAVLAALAAVVVGLGGMVSANASLATLTLSADAGRAGARITVTGASFAVPRPGTDLAPTPVVLHWGNDADLILAEAVPDRYGSIVTTITVPNVAPGRYVVIGTQVTLRRPPDAPPEQPPTPFTEPGTPARISFVVTGPGAPVPLSSPVGPGPVPPSGDLDATVWIVLTAAFAAVAMSLFGGGLIAFLHQSRKSKLPAEANWAPPGWFD